MDETSWKRCVEFHGHACPGLAIGYRAAETAMESLGKDISRAVDEEIVCVTENDACGVDSIQVLTGCTAGKGNMIFRPSGKPAYSFFDRNSGKGVRLVTRPFDRNGDKEAIMKRILSSTGDELFEIKEPHYGMPEKARMFESAQCSECGEFSREDKMRLSGGKLFCCDCHEGYDRG